MIASARERERTRQEISSYSRSLMLSTRVAELCATEATPKQEEFLHRVLSEEMARRDRNRKTRLLNRARFPVLKSFSEYEFSGIRFPPALTREELLSCRFIAERKNLVLYGGVGTGKTHMSLALGIMACEMSLKVRFYTVTELVLKLSDAYRSGTLERLVRDLKQLDLLILDEWGYVPVDREGSQLLFRVIADSYESKSLILTIMWNTASRQERFVGNTCFRVEVAEHVTSDCPPHQHRWIGCLGLEDLLWAPVEYGDP